MKRSGTTSSAVPVLPVPALERMLAVALTRTLLRPPSPDNSVVEADDFLRHVDLFAA